MIHMDHNCQVLRVNIKYGFLDLQGADIAIMYWYGEFLSDLRFRTNITL